MINNSFSRKYKTQFLITFFTVITFYLSYMIFNITTKIFYFQQLANFDAMNIAYLLVFILSNLIALLPFFFFIRIIIVVSLSILNSKKIYNFEHQILKKKIKKDFKPIVALVVPVLNDFCEKQILECFNQTYKNIKKYIIDDSTIQSEIDKICTFCKKHNVNLLHTNEWKKNLYDKGCGLARAFDYFINKTKGEWNYMVHIDSGDIIPTNYVENALKYFCENDKLGILLSSYNGFFTESIYQNILELSFPRFLYSKMYSFETLINNYISCPGANVVFNAKAIYDVGFWPNEQCEDTCMAWNIINKKWLVHFGELTNFYSYEMQVKNNTSNVKRAKRIAKGTFRFLKNKILSVNKNIPFISNLYLFLLKYGGFFFIALFVYPMLLCNIFMFIFPIISYEYNNFLIENYYIVLTKFIIGLLLFCISLFLNFFLSIPEIINNYHFNKKRLFVTIPKINKIFLFSCVLCFSIPISLYTSSFFSVYFAKKKNEFSITPKNVNFINKKTTTKEHIFIDVISITMCLIFSIILFFLISYFFSKNEFIFIRITNIINIVFPFMSLSFNKILCFITLLNLTYKINKIIFSLICLKYISKTYHLPLVDNGFIKV